jgi:hypothetical protein
MPIRIEWKNGAPVAECDTVAEAIEMMRGASSSHNGAIAKTTHPTQQRSVVSEEKPKTTTTRDSLSNDYTAYFSEQKSNVRQWLKTLYHAGRDIKAEDLAEASKIEVNAFGGLLGAISKTSKRANIPLDSIYETTVRYDGPRRERWYSPGEALKEYGGEAFNA